MNTYTEAELLRVFNLLGYSHNRVENFMNHLQKSEAEAPQEAVCEPEYWQWRRKGDPWSLERTFNSRAYATADDSEVRPLFARPAPRQEPAGPTLSELIQKLGGWRITKANRIAVDVTIHPLEMTYEAATPQKAEPEAPTVQRGADSGFWNVRELVQQLVACHEEPDCPAVAWAKDWLAAAPHQDSSKEPTAEAGDHK